MDIKKVLPYRNIGTKENPVWEEYYTITSSEAVYVNEDTKETLDNKLHDIKSNVKNLNTNIEQNSMEIEKIKNTVVFDIINGGNAHSF